MTRYSLYPHHLSLSHPFRSRTHNVISFRQLSQLRDSTLVIQPHHQSSAPTQSNTAQTISNANTPPRARSSTNPSIITTANQTAAKATPLSRPAMRRTLMNGWYPLAATSPWNSASIMAA